jgi:hypothetical protein
MDGVVMMMELMKVWWWIFVLCWLLRLFAFPWKSFVLLFGRWNACFHWQTQLQV